MEPAKPHVQTRPDRSAPNDSGSGASILQIPSLTLPKGAIHGIGEKFAVNPAKGTFSVPIATSPGRCRFGPVLQSPTPL